MFVTLILLVLNNLLKKKSIYLLKILNIFIIGYINFL